VLQISATPVEPEDGALLAEQILSITRGTFELELPEEEAAASTDKSPAA
jgi:hypothetical protein